MEVGDSPSMGKDMNPVPIKVINNFNKIKRKTKLPTLDYRVMFSTCIQCPSDNLIVF
jgi:hypothetical protein